VMQQHFCPQSRNPVQLRHFASLAAWLVSCAEAGSEATLHLVVLPAGTQDRMQAYVDLVCTEVRATRSLADAPLTTVSFGGGVSAEAESCCSSSSGGGSSSRSRCRQNQQQCRQDARCIAHRWRLMVTCADDESSTNTF
jgi:hypothetical protein